MSALPPDKSNMPKRAAKRHVYPREGICDLESKSIEIRLLNISTSGIQFATRIQISSREVLTIHWKDEKFGQFDVTILVAREIQKLELKDFCFLYGVQYINLSPKTKETLLLLLKDFRENDKKDVAQQAQKMPPQYLLGVIDQGDVFLISILDGKPEPYFERMIGEMKGYEKEAFKHDTSPDICLQHAALHNFHCELLKVLALSVVENTELIPEFFQKTEKKLKEIADTENEIEDELEKIKTQDYAEEVRKSLKQSLNESSNRLFYAKQNLLAIIVKTYSPIVQTPELQGFYMPLVVEYEKITNNKATVEEINTYSRKMAKPEAFSKAEIISDVSRPTRKKSKGKWIAAIVFLFLIIGLYLNHSPAKKNMTKEIGTTGKIVNYSQSGEQIDLIMDSSWNQLSDEEKSYDKMRISDYLKKAQISSAVVRDSELNLIYVVQAKAK